MHFWDPREKNVRWAIIFHSRRPMRWCLRCHKSSHAGPGRPFKAEGTGPDTQTFQYDDFILFLQGNYQNGIITISFFERERKEFFITIPESFWSSTVVEKNTHVYPIGFYSSQVGRFFCPRVNTWTFNLLIMLTISFPLLSVIGLPSGWRSIYLQPTCHVSSFKHWTWPLFFFSSKLSCIFG